MNQKYFLWPAIIIVLLIAAGAFYYAWQLYGSRGIEAPPPPATSSETAELDQEARLQDQDLSELESLQKEFEAVETSEDDVAL